MRHFSLTTSLLFIGLFINGSLIAADNLLFKGVLVEPALCTINNDQRINVDFGSRVGISRLDGDNYRQTINYQVNCEQGTTTPDLTLYVNATVSSGDNTAIQTDKMGLGIRLLQNGKPLVLNQPLAIDINNLPVLEAVPVGVNNEKLTEGVFNATASLLAEYR